MLDTGRRSAPDPNKRIYVVVGGVFACFVVVYWLWSAGGVGGGSAGRGGGPAGGRQSSPKSVSYRNPSPLPQYGGSHDTIISIDSPKSPFQFDPNAVCAVIHLATPRIAYVA